MTATSEKSIFISPPPFDKTSAYVKLQKFAEMPFDLTANGALTASRIEAMRADAQGFSYLYGFERIDQETLKTLILLAQERKVCEQMEAMQKGKIANFIEGFESEKRAVLHTACRDIFDSPPLSEEERAARELAKAEIEKLKQFIYKLNSKKQFSEMIFVGIGGSELGPRALFEALSFLHHKDRRVHFISNIDPDAVASVLQKADLSKSCVVVVSKSGTTIETETNEQFLRREFFRKGLIPKDHFIAITTPKSKMDSSEQYLERFYIWDWVGGRFSATSMVGALLLAFSIGMDEFLNLLRGAHEMDKVALRQDPIQNLPLLSALMAVWNRNFLKLPTIAIIPYSQLLHRFPAHLQQCEMESNGKSIDRLGRPVPFDTGPIIWGEPGTNGQHSFYQLIHQGTTPVALEVIGFLEPQGNLDFEWKGTTSQEKLLSNLFAQSIALATGQENGNPNKRFPGNRPSSLLLTKKLNAYSLGALLSFYEHKVAFQGFLWGINSFDQEGVQLGKVLADRLMKTFAAQRQNKPSEPFALGDALLKISQEIGGSR